MTTDDLTFHTPGYRDFVRNGGGPVSTRALNQLLDETEIENAELIAALEKVDPVQDALGVILDEWAEGRFKVVGPDTDAVARVKAALAQLALLQLKELL